jgi:hypothetical protein
MNGLIMKMMIIKLDFCYCYGATDDFVNRYSTTKSYVLWTWGQLCLIACSVATLSFLRQDYNLWRCTLKYLNKLIWINIFKTSSIEVKNIFLLTEVMLQTQEIFGFRTWDFYSAKNIAVRVYKPFSGFNTLLNRYGLYVRFLSHFYFLKLNLFYVFRNASCVHLF